MGLTPLLNNVQKTADLGDEGTPYWLMVKSDYNKNSTLNELLNLNQSMHNICQIQAAGENPHQLKNW